MMKILPLFFAILICTIFSCTDKNTNPTQLTSTEVFDSTKKPADSMDEIQLAQIKREEVLRSHLIDLVSFDSLLLTRIPQNQIKVIASLKETWDEAAQRYQYTHEEYKFSLKIKKSPDGTSTTLFYDGSTCIDFKKYMCVGSHCNQYFNADNTLRDAVIIEVCNKKFLYSDISFMCNGIGCVCVLKMIYDLEHKTPFFTSYYRNPFDGFYISDFNNDSIPDVFIEKQMQKSYLKGFGLEDFTKEFVAYSYSNGTFVPHMDQQFNRPFGFTVYGIGDIYHSLYATDKVSLIENNWYIK